MIQSREHLSFTLKTGEPCRIRSECRRKDYQDTLFALNLRASHHHAEEIVAKQFAGMLAFRNSRYVCVARHYF
jgi:hypothetical protein